MSDYLKAALQELAVEHYDSIQKHGDWDGYTDYQIHKAIADEFGEYTDALVAGDISGRHGQRAELLQLANVALKGWMRLGHVS